MDKYQMSLLNKTTDLLLYSHLGNGSISFLGENIEITQNENYNINDYVLSFKNPAISQVIIGKNSIKLINDGKFEIPISFSKKEELLYIHFTNNVIDDCSIKLIYHDASKDLYDEMIAKENEKQLLNMANIHTACGIDLINVYWQNAREDVMYTIINLFEANTMQFLAAFKSEDNVFYKSITNLAFNKYVIKVEQFNNHDEIVISKSLTVSLDFDNTLKSELRNIVNSLAGVKSQVMASGRHTVIG